MKNQLPVLADFDYDRIGSFRQCNPYVIAFCYTSKKYHRLESFIIKGGSQDVTYYIKQLGFPMVVFTTFWRHGRSRRMVMFENFKHWTATGQTPFVNQIQRRINREKPCYFYRNHEVRFCQRIWFTVRRFPRKWLPEYDEMIEHRYPVADIHS